MADTTIDNLSIQVTASAEEASQIFDRLASNMGKIKGATSGAAQGMKEAADAAKDMGTATKDAGEQAGETQKSVRGLGNDVKKAGKDAKEGSSGLKTFWESLKRIAFYRVVRSVIKSITDAFKTGITNLYQWSKVMDGTFANSMDRIATASLYLKNSLGAMLSPIINTLAPIIDYVVDGLVVIINYINMIFAALSGASTYTAAKKVATTWADAGKSAAGSAKKASDDIRRTILGFDEINKLEKQNSSSGSGSGTKKNGLDYSTMFEKRPINSAIKEIADVIRNTFTPIFDFLGDNLDTVLRVVGYIGAALALWKIGTKLIPGLSNTLGVLKKIGSVLSTLVTAAITVSLVYNFTNKFLETGKYSYLVGDAITTLLGGAISGLTMAKAFGTSAGLYTASAVIAVSGLINLILGINDIDKNGLQKENVMTLISAGVKGAIAGGLIAKAAGFSVVSGMLTGALVMGITIGLVATFKLVKFKPEIELTDQQQEIINEIESGNFDNAMKLSDKYNQNYNQLVAAKSGGRTKSKSLWNKIEEIMGWVAYGEDDKSILPNANSTNVVKQIGAGRDPSKIVQKYTVPLDINRLMNTTAKNKINEFTSTIVTSATKIKTAMFDGSEKAKKAISSFVGKYGQLRDNALGITWERVGENISDTLSEGQTRTWPEAKAKFDKSMEELRNSGYTYSYDAIGKYIVNTLSGGINSDAWQVIKTISDLAWNMFHKPEEVPWITFGESIPEDIGTGISNNQYSAVQVATDLGWYIYNGFSGISFWDIGYNICADIYNGIVENVNWVQKAAKSLVSSVGGYITGNNRLTVSTKTVKHSTASKPKKSTRANALGGIFSNGIWSDIPQYANGTLNAGSLFWAGENGPEIVGRASGRTEVLNRSQIASAMYSAVQAAMAPAAANFAAAANYLQSNNNAFDIEMLAEMVRQGVESAMERQGDIQRQQLDTLRQINAKEFSTEISTASISKAQARMNRRAGMTVVPVSQ